MKLTRRRAILSAVVFNLILLSVAWQRWERLNVWISRPLNQLTPERERTALESLASVAATGSWDSFDKSRNEQVAQLLSLHARTSSNAAVYFFPETLPAQSLERSFVSDALEPGIQSLRRAYEGGQTQQARAAFKLLETRVGNYELGASGAKENLSPEARLFLDTYENFTRVQNARVPTSKQTGENHSK